jgi:hypothetical protein
MIEQSPLIAPDVAAAAIEILRLAGDASAMTARLEHLTEASTTARQLIDAAAEQQAALVTARTAHEKTLAELTAKQKVEHDARMAELGATLTKQSDQHQRNLTQLANIQKQIDADKERVASKELAAEARAAYLTKRIQDVEQRGVQ